MIFTKPGNFTLSAYEEFMKKAATKPEPPPWISDAPAAKGHPDANDLAELKELIIKTV